MERRMTTKVFVLTKMMADLLKTAQHLKTMADRLLAQGNTEGANCLYAAFLQSYNRSTRPFLVQIKAEMLCQDPKCAEYIYRIIELAFNVQMAVISAEAKSYSEQEAIELLDDFLLLFSDKFQHTLPQFHGGLKSNLVKAFHFELLFGYYEVLGVDEVTETLKELLEVRPSDERLSHDLNLAKKLQARAHVSQLSLWFGKLSKLFQDEQDRHTWTAELLEEWELSSSLTALPLSPFTCASDHYVVPQSFELEGWEPGNGPYRLTPTEQRAVHDLQDERGWPRSGFD